ncbi:MAG: DUF4175 family protein [Phycisphaerae bacterium]
MTIAEPPSPPSSTPHLPRAYHELTARLDAIASRLRTAAVLRALARLLLVNVPLTTAALLLIGFLHLPASLNLTLLLVITAAWLLAYTRRLHPALFHRPTYAEIARHIEQNAQSADLPVDNNLINAILLAADYEHAPKNAPWIPHLLREAHAHTKTLPLEQTIPWKPARNASLAAGLALLLCIAVVAAFHTTITRALLVLAHPASTVPIEGSVKILSVQPGNDTLLAGESLNILATVQSPDNKPVPTTLTLPFHSGKSQTFTMSPFTTGTPATTQTQSYRYQFPAVAEDLDSTITAGDSQSTAYHVTVLPQLHLASLTIDATPPQYTGRDKSTLTLAGKNATPEKANIELPAGSLVTLSATLDLPVREMLLELPAAPPVPLTPSSDGKTFSTTLTLKDNLQYAFRANDNSHRTLHRFPDSADGTADTFTLSAAPDLPPTIAVTHPAKDSDAQPGDHLSLSAQATDDYGLTQISLQLAKNNDKDFHTAQTWPISPDKSNKPTRAATINFTLDLPATDYKLGDTLRYRFIATDNRDLTSLDHAGGGLMPQSTTGQIFTITFNDTAAAAAKSTKLWDQLRAQLQKLLDQQITLRKAAQTLAPTNSLQANRRTATQISNGQKPLRTDMQTLAQTFPFDPSMKLIEKSLQVLVLEDAAAAIDRSADILLLADTDQKSLTPLATRLRQHQSRIIDVLQTLLAIANADESHISKQGDAEGADLPNEAKDAWKKLAEDLKKFEKDQNAVINATADLAKKPKDEYDQNDEKKIADLKAIEDKWENFLNNRLVDMSKIAEQDQANASLLDEMVQMKVELAAAANALDQKATQIATPLEENGLENAKALDTHIERMLMQTPDHTQWQMEEPVTQNDPAMAELPEQLQDMIGDLMDKQEDLTDEMESTASKFADSLNKGAGWDAADGPISNMSAQGVTGNQLPKNMEIQGRSGEGREGRSSGEFVGAEAEGKGGRQTPTRMTSDPFSAGQVQDHSQQPAGGATGGGKKGGFGGEGREGQAPDEGNITQRLQGQQAQLRNQAERLSLQMHAAGFNNFKLLEANVQMKKAEDALKQYHYQTALYYDQQAIQSLNTAKVLAAGQVHVITDTSPTADEKTQKDIENATHGPLPKGYSDPVKAYFQKLSDTQNQ